MKILLVNPPLSAPTGPYPGICYLAGFLETIGQPAALADASLALLLRVFSSDGVTALAAAAESRRGDATIDRFLTHAAQYIATVESAVACLQGRDSGAFARASRRGYFPPPLDAASDWAFAAYYTALTYEADLDGLTADQRRRLHAREPDTRAAFGRVGAIDAAQFRASQVLDDICRVVRSVADPDFHIDAYAEHLTNGAATFGELGARLSRPPTFIDTIIDAIAGELWAQHRPDVLGLSVPFSGNLYGALRIAAVVKRHAPNATIVMGGGWVNTELRQLTDPGIFDFVDYITLDDGERPLERLLDVVTGRRDRDALVRTFLRVDGHVVYMNSSERDVPFAETGTPTYRDLPTQRYLAIRPTLQSFSRISAGRWNKLTIAHGCYWKKCTFCDTSLDYIGRYDPAPIDVTIRRIRALIDETGETGFHFVDEAMPPAAIKLLAERLIAEKLRIAWWGNVRFDAALAPLAPLLAESGCIAITGGLEVASDRVLKLIDKGITLGQAARVCRALASQDIFTHAYLIYGFPTQTAQETIDALDFVRQLFEAGALHSAFWHRFELTAHSPIARDPERFGITIRPTPPRPFTNLILEYDEPGRIDHAAFGLGLHRAVDHYALGLKLDTPLSSWFDFAVPDSRIARDLVRQLVRDAAPSAPRPAQR